MKDYESYNNKGNKDIPDNPKLKKNEFYARQFVDNELPGEYFDIRENALDCDLDDDDKYAYDPGERGSMDTKDQLDNFQDLTNVVNTTTQASASIVESAGTVVTGTATVVVGASAAIVAFNATSKAQPTMKVNQLDSGSSFVHYNLEINNLDLDKDYDIVVRNGIHEFKLDCSNGINDEYVYNLKPGLQYSLSLVGYNELLGEIPYVTKTFFTLSSEETLGYSNIEIVYNDDLTCGIKYDTTMVDDYNTMGDTFIVIKMLVDGQGGEEWDLFNSLYAEDFMREEPDKYTYEYLKKVHKGSISEVPPGLLTIELHKMGDEGEEWDGELIASTSKDIVYPIYEESGSNYIKFSGDYNLIKDVKSINVKKDNLVAKISLFNEENVETKIEKEIDITNGLFELKQLVKQDTVLYNYQIGYYKADKTFVVVKEKKNETIYGGYYDGSYLRITPDDRDKIIVKWKQDTDNYELADITLLTEFDNFGNDAAYYRAELLKVGYDDSTGESTYTVVSTYEGTGNAVFKNVEIGKYIFNENRYYETYYYTFRYTSLMDYYNSETLIEKVTFDVTEPDPYANDLNLRPTLDVGDGDFELLSNGKYAIHLYGEVEQQDNKFDYIFDEANIKLTMHFFKKNSEVIDETLVVKNPMVKKNRYGEMILVIDEDLPTGMIGYYIEYEVPYYEQYGGNLRTLRTTTKKLMGDISYKLTPTRVNRRMQGSYSYLCVELIAYMPDNYRVGKDNGSGYTPSYLQKVGDNTYKYELVECSEGDSFVFEIYDENGEKRTYYAYSISMEDDPDIVNLFEMPDMTTSDFTQNNIVYTYNSDGTININLITDVTMYDNELYDIEFNYRLLIDKDDTGGYSFTVDVKDDGSKRIISFNNVDSYHAMEYLKTYYIEVEISATSKNTGYGSYENFMQLASRSCQAFTAANLYSISNQTTLTPYYMSADGYVSLSIPNDAVFDENQTIVFSGTYNSDPLEDYEVKLSDATKVETADGIEYHFDLPSDYVDVLEYSIGNVNMDIYYNYTLSKDKMDILGNNYSGNLYKVESLAVSRA